MPLVFVESHPTYRLTYSLNGPLLTCIYSSWLRGSSETTYDLRTVSPHLGRVRVRDATLTPYFLLAAVLSLSVGVAWLIHLGDRLVDFPVWTVGSVFALALVLIAFAAAHPFRAEWVGLHTPEGRPVLHIRRPRKASSAFEQFLQGVMDVLQKNA